MFRNILVGVDGRRGGRDAMALARQLSAPNASITLAHVSGDTKEATNLLERERAASTLDADIVAEPGRSVARGLRGVAERGAFELIVIGSCHRGVLGRVVAGDDAQQTLDQAPCPVAIAPAGYETEEHRLSRLGVGFDGSPEAGHALALARRIEGSDGPTLEALFVLPVQTKPYGETVGRRWRDVAHQFSGDEARRLDALASVDGSVSYGVPGPELARFSDSVDLLVIGRRRGGRLRHLDGSSSTYLARHAGCPVLIVGEVQSCFTKS